MKCKMKEMRWNTTVTEFWFTYDSVEPLQKTTHVS